MKFLVVRFSSIGDIVLTTPVVRCLKKQVPNAMVHYLVKPNFKTVIAHNPYIDKIHVLQEDWQAMIEELKTEHFDHIIDLHHNLRTFRLKKDLHVPAHAFNKLNIEKFIFVKLKWNVMPRLHIIDRYLQTVKSFGVVNDGDGMEYVIAPEDEVSCDRLPETHRNGYIALVIGASFKTKKLPIYKLQELCSKINHPIVLLGGREEAGDGDEICKAAPEKVFNACGKFSLNQSADLVRKSKLVISHDTGLMHIAAALKKPVIAVWGSTTPSFGMVPYYGDHFLAVHPQLYDDVQVHKLWCRPCTKMGRDKCPQGHFKCMKDIDIDAMVRLTESRLYG